MPQEVCERTGEAVVAATTPVGEPKVHAQSPVFSNRPEAGIVTGVHGRTDHWQVPVRARNIFNPVGDTKINIAAKLEIGPDTQSNILEGTGTANGAVFQSLGADNRPGDIGWGADQGAMITVA